MACAQPPCAISSMCWLGLGEGAKGMGGPKASMANPPTLCSPQDRGPWSAPRPNRQNRGRSHSPKGQPIPQS